MKINFKSENSSTHLTPCLIVPCIESTKPTNCAKELDDKFKGAIAAAYKEKRFEGKANQTLLLNSLGLVKAQNILLIGIIGFRERYSEWIPREILGVAEWKQQRTTFITMFFPKL